MAYTLRVSLPTYNALTDTNPDHYALYADSDWILIKEKARGSCSISNGNTETISHDLGYIPYTIVFYNISSGVWKKIQARDDWEGLGGSFTLTTTQLLITNNTGSTKTFKYYIFYDNISP